MELSSVVMEIKIPLTEFNETLRGIRRPDIRLIGKVEDLMDMIQPLME
ncbi:hypothetical protein [Jeotgalibacillus alimentarius]|nr:hypothetical protein [Jeotgalibacillus alimentarius]